MADRKLTTDDLLASLNDIRLPTEAAGGQLAEIFAAVGLGLLFALAISAVLPLVTKRTTAARSYTIEERIAHLHALSDKERALALLRLLKEQKPDVAERLSKTIYAPGGMPNLSVLEAELRKADA